MVAKIEQIDGVLRHIRSEAHLCDDGAFEVIIAIDAHGAG
jgi:hypothetical protein